MSERTDLHFFQDIQESIHSAIEFFADYDVESFSSDRKTKSAAVRELEIIGDAANRVSSENKDKYSSVPWRLIMDFRKVNVNLRNLFH